MANPTLAALQNKSDSVYSDDLLAMLLLGVGPDGTLITSTPGNLRKTTTVAGTAVKLSASSLPVRRAVVAALATNAGVVVVGGSTVVAASGTRNSPPLSAGDSIELSRVDLTSVYLDSTVSGEGVVVYYEA